MKVGGLFAPVYKLIKKPAILVGTIFFFCLSFWANTLYFETQFNGDARLFSNQVESVFNEVGIKKFHPFTQAQLDEVNKKLLTKENLSFISVV